jgi:hypothetical protein
MHFESKKLTNNPSHLKLKSSFDHKQPTGLNILNQIIINIHFANLVLKSKAES